MAPTLITPRDPYAHGIEDTILISLFLLMMFTGIILLAVAVTRAEMHNQGRRMRDVLFYNTYGKVRGVNLWVRGDGYRAVGDVERGDGYGGVGGVERGERQEEEEGKEFKGENGGFMVLSVDEDEEEEEDENDSGEEEMSCEKGQSQIFIIGEDEDEDDDKGHLMDEKEQSAVFIIGDDEDDSFAL